MSHAIKSAAIAIFRPLVRFLIGHGWTYGAMAELLKVVCVEESSRQHEPGAPPLTDSKVSLLSGVHRKEVNRIRQELAAHSPDELPMRQGANIAAQLVALWVSHPDFLDATGEPLPLPRRAEKSPCIEELARRIKADMRPRTILDDLIRAGIAEERSGHFHLLRATYVSDVPEDRLNFLGANVGDHLSSAVRNLQNAKPPFIEQAVYFDALPPEVIEAVREDLRQLGNKMIRTAYQRVSKLDTDADSPHPRRMRMGVYYYEEDAAPRAPAERQEDIHD
ncbi:MAG: DUF6502 family protein [Halothiobacillus sp.]|jgi:hypothetical protein|nr:DUF6502 family protein [Halothiobacillus sp.]